jgi:Asp-tRNA(Asn)/Glu-tRNA(Gln) amidotransferase A subunit family amidase
MSPEQLARLFQQRSQTRFISFDEQTVPNTSVNDLNESLWRRFVAANAVDDPMVTLRKMKLLADDDTGIERATVAGVLMCSRHPEGWLPGAFVEAVRYRGNVQDSHHQADAARITGPLDQQITQALAFARRNMTVAAVKTPARQEIPQFSERAIFEALVNAVAHRDYSIYGSKIRLFMFDDRLELYSPGDLPNTVTIESLPLRQATRNELVTSLLARCPVEPDDYAVGRRFLMEKRGDGVPIILNESLAHSGKSPEYRLIDDAELVLTIYSAELPNRIRGSHRERSEFMATLREISASELAERIRTKQISSEEVVEAHIRRIEQVNPEINAVVQMRAEAALAEAREADKALAGGRSTGPLHGVPMTIKDSFDTRDLISTGGSSRLPAHFCGIAGLKPTQGRVPRTGHIISYTGYLQALTHIGPLARCVDDLYLLLKIIAGPDWRDPFVENTAEIPGPTALALHDLRLAYYTNIGELAPIAAIKETVEKVAAALQGEKVRVEEAAPAGVDRAYELYYDLFRADGYAWVRELLEEAGTTTAHPLLAWATDSSRSQALPTGAFTKLLTEWDRFRSEMLHFMESYDAILCPVNAWPALPHGSSKSPPYRYGFSHTLTYNLAGWPVVVVPAGKANDGLPTGVQIAARPWREDVALALARFVEQECGGEHFIPGRAIGKFRI